MYVAFSFLSQHGQRLVTAGTKLVNVSADGACVELWTCSHAANVFHQQNFVFNNRTFSIVANAIDTPLRNVSGYTSGFKHREHVRKIFISALKLDNILFLQHKGQRFRKTADLTECLLAHYTKGMKE